jgi:glucose-1-phosphate cytidylyltransferase
VSYPEEEDIGTMPVVILAGGRGARFDSESQIKPKPMIEVAGKPIIQHIIDGFVAQGFKEFLVATGYLELQLWDHFIAQRASFHHLMMIPSQVAVGCKNGALVRCISTGEASHTGERVVRLRDHIKDRRFILTYGDGLCDVRMRQLLNHHHYDAHYGGLVTITAVPPPGRFGAVELEDPISDKNTRVKSFHEKPYYGLINGGFMVCEPQFIDLYLRGPDGTSFELERYGLATCAEDGKLHAYTQNINYWACMDTRRDLEQIEADVAANGGKLPWRRDA